MSHYNLEQSWLPHFLFTNKVSAPLWFVVRLYVGYEWLMASIEKVVSPMWVGTSAGAALNGFVQGALLKTSGAHPDVSQWYASFLNSTVLTHLSFWSNVVAIGELLVAIALIAGAFVGLAAFFGAFMNLNFMLAGSVSINPVLFTLSIFLVLAWRVAGYWGADAYLLPKLRRFHIWSPRFHAT